MNESVDHRLDDPVSNYDVEGYFVIYAGRELQHFWDPIFNCVHTFL